MHDSPFSTSLLYSAEQSIQFQNFLSKHLPYTLPLLRRLQYEDRSAQAVIISSFNPDEAQSPSTWAIAFFDRFVDIGITSCVLSSSLDLPIHEKISKSQQDHDDVLRHLRAVFKSIKLRNVALSSPEDVVLVHSVKASTADALRHDPQFNAIRDDLNDINGTDDACYGKYLVRPNLLREAADSSLPHGFYYDAVRSWDLQLVANTSSLVPSARYLQGKPSAGIREESTGLLRAWAFCKYDGSIGTVYTDPAFRRRAFGRKVVSKCILDNKTAYGNPTDDWAHTDIASDNEGSVRLFQSLGATHSWNSYWLRIDMAKVDEYWY